MKEYGADGVRMGMLLCAPAGNDIFFDKKLCEQGRNFCNKIWNSFRLIKGWEVDETLAQPESSKTAIRWFKAELEKAVAEINDLFAKFRISEALIAVYRLFRDEFSSWYLEMVKPAYQKPIDRKTLDATIEYLDTLLRLLHPFMPFITEELWQHLAERADGESIMYSTMPQAGVYDADIIAEMETIKEIVNGVRSVRAAKNIPNKETLKLNIVGEWEAKEADLLAKLCNLSEIANVKEKDASASAFLVGTVEFNVPLADSIDKDAELAKLRKDLDYYEGFLRSVQKKLSNERFVNGAPATVVDAERKKEADALSKIEALKASISALS